MVKIIVLFYLTVITFLSGGSSDKIQSRLLSHLQKSGQANVLISFKDGIKPALERASSLRQNRDRGSRNTAIIKILEDHADASQGGVIQTLTARSNAKGNQGFKYFKQYKSANLVFVKEATLELLQSIANDPKVAKIEMEPANKLVPLTPTTEDDPQLTRGWQPPIAEDGLYVKAHNLRTMQMIEAWKELGEHKGDHVVVGFIDTGARLTHEALRDNFRGEYGWYDPVEKKSEPYEADWAHGHGTQITGVGVGTRIGVAPGVKWMACAACTSGGCEAEPLLDCIQFMECPTLPDGSERDCSKAPHVVNNSWVSIRGETGYSEFVLRWRELGIIPVFAVGNDGPQCARAAAPGEYPFVIGVGGSRKNGTEWYDVGSVGPASDGKIKPDLVAPVNAISATRIDDVSYGWADGTSSATAAVSGIVALLKVRDPDITYDEVYNLLTTTTHITTLSIPRKDWTCNGTADYIPNNFYGYGHVNAYRALKAQTKMLAEKGKKF